MLYAEREGKALSVLHAERGRMICKIVRKNVNFPL